MRMRARCLVQTRRYASHVTRTPLIFPLRPPDPPPAPPTTSSPTPPKPTAMTASPTMIKPRLDYTSFLYDPDRTTANHLTRNARLPLGKDHVAHLQRLRSTQLLLISKLQTIRAKQREIGEVIRSNLADREDALRQAKKLKSRIGDYETTLSDTEAELLELGLVLPNTTHPDVPVGAEDKAIELERFGADMIPSDPRRDHLRIANHFGLLDNDASTVATGSSWPYLKGALALLEMAIVNFAVSVAVKHGYTPVIPPDVVRSDIAWRCGFQPRDSSEGPSQTYRIQTAEGSPELCLAGTSEIPLSALFANQILPHDILPRRVVGIGRAFRAEAGARGVDTRGLYRVHQFTKVELFAASEPARSEVIMAEMIALQAEIANGLGLCMRVLDMPTEELGASAFRKQDMEAWMPGRGGWGEISSTSNCTDYQARRLHIRHRHPSLASERQENEGLPFAHTLNGTAAAIPRLLIALMENGVRLGTDGDIEGLDLPGVLKRFWLGGDEVGEGKSKRSIHWTGQ